MRKISKEVRVDYVSPDGSRLTIIAGNVKLYFTNVNGKPEFSGKISEARVYDPANLYLSSKLYADAWRLAAAVMKEKRKKYKAKSLREYLQYSLSF